MAPPARRRRRRRQARRASPAKIRPPAPGLSIVTLVFIGTIAVGVVAGPTAVVALPAIFGCRRLRLAAVGALTPWIAVDELVASAATITMSSAMVDEIRLRAHGPLDETS
jgi:hypothetical protein